MGKEVADKRYWRYRAKLDQTAMSDSTHPRRLPGLPALRSDFFGKSARPSDRNETA